MTTSRSETDANTWLLEASEKVAPAWTIPAPVRVHTQPKPGLLARIFGLTSK